MQSIDSIAPALFPFLGNTSGIKFDPGIFCTPLYTCMARSFCLSFASYYISINHSKIMIPFEQDNIRELMYRLAEAR